MTVGPWIYLTEDDFLNGWESRLEGPFPPPRVRDRGDGTTEFQGSWSAGRVEIHWPKGLPRPGEGHVIELYMPRFDDDGMVISTEGTLHREVVEADGEIVLHIWVEP